MLGAGHSIESGMTGDSQVMMGHLSGRGAWAG